MFYMQQRLLKRKPKVMFSYFIESIFHFNAYEGHDTYNKMPVSDKEKELFSLKGKDNQETRMTLYKFMLDHMNDENRFQITYNICKDILNGVVEGGVKLSNPSALELLQDALACLASDEIKLASLKAKQDDGNDFDANTETNLEQQGRELVEAALKKKIISTVVKKNTMENIIPIIIALKHKLEKMKSPLLDDLMNCLRELMKDYKNEVKEILAADKQLATEIQYDLKKWEQEMEERRRREEEERVSFICAVFTEFTYINKLFNLYTTNVFFAKWLEKKGTCRRRFARVEGRRGMGIRQFVACKFPFLFCACASFLI